MADIIRIGRFCVTHAVLTAVQCMLWHAWL